MNYHPAISVRGYVEHLTAIVGAETYEIEGRIDLQIIFSAVPEGAVEATKATDSAAAPPVVTTQAFPPSSGTHDDGSGQELSARRRNTQRRELAVTCVEIEDQLDEAGRHDEVVAARTRCGAPLTDARPSGKWGTGVLLALRAELSSRLALSAPAPTVDATEPSESGDSEETAASAAPAIPSGAAPAAADDAPEQTRQPEPPALALEWDL